MSTNINIYVGMHVPRSPPHFNPHSHSGLYYALCSTVPCLYSMQVHFIKVEKELILMFFIFAK